MLRKHTNADCKESAADEGRGGTFGNYLLRVLSTWEGSVDACV